MYNRGRALDYDNYTRSFINITAAIQSVTHDQHNNEIGSYSNLKGVRLCERKEFWAAGLASVFDSKTKYKNSLFCVEDYEGMVLKTR